MARALKVVCLSVALVAVVHVAAGSGADPPKVGHLTTAFSFDTSKGMPIEGAVSYVVLRRKPGGEVLRAEFRGNTRSVAVPVEPGRYRLSTFQRTCSGTCDHLDEASYGCGYNLRMRSDRRVRARVRVFWGADTAAGERGCRIRLAR